MDGKDTKLLEELLDSSKNPVYRARHGEPYPPVISAEYIMKHTVELLGFKVIGDCEYWVTIKPYSNETKGNSGLVVSLFERELSSRHKSSVSVSIPLARLWDTASVNVVAALLAEKYEESERTLHDSIPEKEMLRQLIAGRVEFYKRGGNCSKLENRKN